MFHIARAALASLVQKQTKCYALGVVFLKFWKIICAEILESNFTPTWVKMQKESECGENFCNVFVDYKCNKSCFAFTVEDRFSLVFCEKCF